MRFSLVIGTLNRLEAIKSCLQSISEQTYSDYEVIIIDQSEGIETEEYIKTINDNRIIYRHVKFKGLSKARNEALKFATGDFFCLMDDDAYYDKNYLEEANKNCDTRVVLSGYIFDTIKNTDFVRYRNKTQKHQVNLREIMKTCPSAALIIPMELIKECGLFDERFGVGATWGSGEETDLLLRGIEKGFIVKYIPYMRVKHPVPIKECLNEDIQKKVKYFEGLGALYKKHMINGNMRKLQTCYYEIWIKFYIKQLLFFKYNRQDVCKMVNGFKNGLEGTL